MTEPTANSTTATDPNSQLNTQQTPATKPPAEPTFTQKDMDAVAGRTRKEAADAARKALLKELGIADVEDPKAVDTVKTKLTAAQQAEEAQKTEAQKLQDRITALEKERDTAAQKAAEALSKAVAERVNSRIESLAKDSRVQTPGDVVDYLEKHHTDELKSAATEDGKPDEKRIAELIEMVKKARPHWFAPGTPGSPSLRDALPGTPVDKKKGTVSTFNAIKRGGW